MGSGGIEFNLAGNSTEVVRAIDRYTAAIDKATRKTEEHGRRSKKNSEDTKKGFELSTKSVAGFVSGLGLTVTASGAVLAATSLIRKEWESISKLQREAALSTQTRADAVRDLRLNFTADATIGDKGLEGSVSKVSTSTGSGGVAAAQVLSAAFSSKGTLTNKQAEETATKALLLSPEDTGQAIELASRANDVRNLGASTEEALGLILGTQSASRTLSAKTLGKSSLKAVNAIVAGGATREQAFELFSATTTLTKDDTGEQSGTGLIRLNKLLGEFDGGDAFANAKGATNKLRVLQQNPELAARFLEENTFDSFTDTTFRQLVRGDKVAVDTLASAERQIAGGKGAEKFYRDKLGVLEAGRLQAFNRAERQRKAKQEQAEIDDEALSTAGLVRAELEGTLNKVNVAGPDDVNRSAALVRFDAQLGLGVDPFEAAIRETEFQQKRIREGAGGLGIFTGGGEGAIKQLDELIVELRGLRGDVKEGRPNRGANVAKKPAAEALEGGG